VPPTITFVTRAFCFVVCCIPRLQRMSSKELLPADSMCPIRNHVKDNGGDNCP